MNAAHDHYEKHRETMRLKHRVCTPYRLGYAVGHSGEDLPNPYDPKQHSYGNYREGLRYGREKRKREAQGAQQ